MQMQRVPWVHRHISLRTCASFWPSGTRTRTAPSGLCEGQKPNPAKQRFMDGKKNCNLVFFGLFEGPMQASPTTARRSEDACKQALPGVQNCYIFSGCPPCRPHAVSCTADPFQLLRIVRSEEGLGCHTISTCSISKHSAPGPCTNRFQQPLALSL